jgi:hypothetical protein
VPPLFGFGIASGDLISFNVPAGEPALTPGRLAAAPADVLTRTARQPPDPSDGAEVTAPILASTPIQEPDPLTALSSGGPDDLLGPVG